MTCIQLRIMILHEDNRILDRDLNIFSVLQITEIISKFVRVATLSPAYEISFTSDNRLSSIVL